MRDTKIPLSTTIERYGIFLTLKWSKGCTKEICLGAGKKYQVQKLSFVLNPKLDTTRFTLSVKGDSAILKQDERGDITIKINSDISIDGYLSDTETDSTESINDNRSYIKSCFIQRKNKGISRYEKWFPITLH